MPWTLFRKSANKFYASTIIPKPKVVKHIIFLEIIFCLEEKETEIRAT